MQVHLTAKYSTAKLRSEHEDITQRMMDLGKVGMAEFTDEFFMEVDTPEEYHRMLNDFDVKRFL